MKRFVNIIIKIALPLILGGAILYWMYRDFNFSRIEQVVMHEMDWTWMLLSFPFGIMAQVFRAWRWQLTLHPLNANARHSTSINAIFLSYAASLIIPRVGEFTRCGVLKRYDGISFSKALGTVVTERAVDTLFMLILTAIAFLAQLKMFNIFFDTTGTNIEELLTRFSTTGYIVTAICALAVLILLHFLLKKLSFYNKVKATLGGIWQGVVSLKDVGSVPRYIFFTLSIWLCYFLHYYLTFFCFEATSHLGMMCALATFIVGSIAVIVPTPNGAGPWHFAVKTMLILYGVADEQALYFVLIVHTVQTMLLILLGVWACIHLSMTAKRNEQQPLLNQ